ncbi:MAG: serine hydrolase [Candidatus Eremiobacteraeota bacterium]|nr:serine hydrolase [Candidatus Eremiobacteraeota bacterium]
MSRLAAVCLAVLVCCMATPASAYAPGPLGALQIQLATATMHAPGNVAVEIKDLATGYAMAINAGANMPAASTIKIPVMVEVFRQMALGKFDLNRALHVEPYDRDWGSGDLVDARTGTARTVTQLLWLMITESDNTATNMLIRLVGRSHINATMRSLGLDNTWLGDDIRSEGNIRSLRSSPSDMVHLLDDLAHVRLVDEWSSREMLAILAGQHHNGLIPAPLPKGLSIAHKTGTLHDTLNDVGIVYLTNEPYIIAVMTTHLRSLELGRRFIRRVSKLAFASFERFEHWRTSMGLPGFQPIASAVQTSPLLGPPASGDADPGTSDTEMLPAESTPAPEPSTTASPSPAPTDQP